MKANMARFGLAVLALALWVDALINLTKGNKLAFLILAALCIGVIVLACLIQDNPHERPRTHRFMGKRPFRSRRECYLTPAVKVDWRFEDDPKVNYRQSIVSVSVFWLQWGTWFCWAVKTGRPWTESKAWTKAPEQLQQNLDRIGKASNRQAVKLGKRIAQSLQSKGVIQ